MGMDQGRHHSIEVDNWPPGPEDVHLTEDGQTRLAVADYVTATEFGKELGHFLHTPGATLASTLFAASGAVIEAQLDVSQDIQHTAFFRGVIEGSNQRSLSRGE